MHFISYLISFLITVSFHLLACDDNEVQPLEPYSPTAGTQTAGSMVAGELNSITCGDGLCHPSEVASLFPQDCAYCGNQICDGDEDENNCPSDCGHSTTPFDGPDQGMNEDQDINADQDIEEIDQMIPMETTCGDQICEDDELSATCPIDCLMDGPQPDSSGEILGYVDSIQQRNGQWYVKGWACHQGWAPSIAVDIYAGGDETSGVFVKRMIAQEPQEDAVGQACGVNEGQHRFEIPFTEEELTTHAGEAIHVHGVSPVGNENLALNNSGNFRLPGGGTVGGSELPMELNTVTWLHTDVSGWPVTSNLSVSIENGIICLEYDKKNVWPTVEIPHTSGEYNIEVVANPWVFLEYQGQWFAGTWEWLVVGGTCKNLSSVAGDHIKQPAFVPLDWRPTSGQRLYFMVSGLARISSITNIQERTQIVEVIWP